jgi:methionine-rich copper-binding protein CopC
MGRPAPRLSAVVAVLAATVLIAAVLIAAVLAPAPASAHGRLVSSTPADGSTVTAALDTVTLAFAEKPAQAAFFSVTAPSGVRVDQAWSHAEPFRLTTPVVEYQQVDGQWQPRESHAGFPVRVPVTHWPERGPYVVRYQSVASDGDAVTGEIRFTYGGEVTPAPPGFVARTDGPTAPAEAVPPAQDQGPWRWLVPVLLVVAVAGAVALALTGPTGRRLTHRRG